MKALARKQAVPPIAAFFSGVSMSLLIGGAHRGTIRQRTRAAFVLPIRHPRILRISRFTRC